MPYLKPKTPGQRDSSGSPTKISKVKDQKGGSPKNTGHGKGGSKGGTTTSSSTTPLPGSSQGSTATSSSSHGASEEKSKVVIEEVKPTVPATLVSDLSGLVKSLQSLKAVHLRYIESKANGVRDGSDQKLALLDGGATHGLRQGRPQELEGAEKVTVELAEHDLVPEGWVQRVAVQGGCEANHSSPPADRGHLPTKGACHPLLETPGVPSHGSDQWAESLGEERGSHE